MDIVKQIHKLLIRSNKTVAVAESCTGGILSGLLSDLSGSSKYFKCGVVAYSNSAKEAVLKIPHTLIAKQGAVSGVVAQSLAENIRKIVNADFGLSVTGIAGPGGERPGKPVGTVFIALAAKNKILVRKFNLRGSRANIRKQAAVEALCLLEEHLLK